MPCRTLIHGDKKAGFTIFWADDGLDTGPILLQKSCVVEPDDTVETLYNRYLYPEGIKALVLTSDVFYLFIYLLIFIVVVVGTCDAVALLVGHWTCDLQIAGLSPGWSPLHSGLGQATYTCVPVSPSSIIRYQPRG